MSSSALVLLSGGLDSTVNLYLAHQEMDVQAALTINYGQRAFAKERVAAAASCKHLGIEHIVMDLTNVFAGFQSSLVNGEQVVPVGDDVDIESVEQSKATAAKVWVPNRNGVLLNVAAAVAESRDVAYVIPGFNREEAETFPDNSYSYLEALNHAFSFSTMNRVQLRCYTHTLDKVEIYQSFLNLEIPPSHVWSCYFGGETPCGECESCLRFERARKICEELNA